MHCESSSFHIRLQNKFAVEASIAATNAVKKFTENSCVFDQSKYDSVPRFHREDFDIKCILGRGGFGNVYAIRSSNKSENSKLCPSNSTCTKETYEDSSLVVKHLRHDILSDRSEFKEGAADLAVEAHLLSSINHPNIINIHGISSAGLSGFEFGEDGFFIIMNRLRDTLHRRIGSWAGINQRSIKNILNFGKCKQRAFFIHRLCVALDVSSALKYLHEKNIVYRDLKTENVGFDMEGNVKLFDFGLAREIRPEFRRDDGTYRMTDFVGSPRYMAPEIAKCLPYNLSVDVYSFGLLIWELCALRTPFDGYSYQMLSDLVVYGDERPKVKKSWPTSIKALMKKCWSKHMSDRPNFDCITGILKEEINVLHGKNRKSDVSLRSRLNLRKRVLSPR